MAWAKEWVSPMAVKEWVSDTRCWIDWSVLWPPPKCCVKLILWQRICGYWWLVVGRRFVFSDVFQLMPRVLKKQLCIWERYIHCVAPLNKSHLNCCQPNDICSCRDLCFLTLKKSYSPCLLHNLFILTYFSFRKTKNQLFSSSLFFPPLLAKKFWRMKNLERIIWRYQNFKINKINLCPLKFYLNYGITLAWALYTFRHQ